MSSANSRAASSGRSRSQSGKRSEVLPDVPTTQEAGISGYEAYGWFAMLAPKGTPAPIIDKLHASLHQGDRRSRNPPPYCRGRCGAGGFDAVGAARVHGGGSQKVGRHHPPEQHQGELITSLGAPQANRRTCCSGKQHKSACGIAGGRASRMRPLRLCHERRRGHIQDIGESRWTVSQLNFAL